MRLMSNCQSAWNDKKVILCNIYSLKTKTNIHCLENPFSFLFFNILEKNKTMHSNLLKWLS